MRIRRLIGTFAALLLALIALPHALAAEEVRILVTANPAELSEAGDVQLNFSISNYSDYELHGVTISSGGTAYDLKQSELIIPPNGSAYDIVITVPVSDSEIGLPIDFTVAWTQGGEPMSKIASVTINRAADPVITLGRTVSAALAREGDEITVQYTLTNNTKFDMSNVTLIDEALSNTPILSNDALRAGSTLTIPLKYRMSTADVVSAPNATYTVLGKTKTFSAIEPVTVKLIVTKLALSVEPGAPTMDGVNFALEVKNTGNQDISNITILDDKQNFVNADPFSLAAGETEALSYRVLADMDETVRNVSFSISGTDALSNRYTLEPSAAYPVYPYVDDSQIATSIRAEILEPWSSSLGALKVRITIDNQSTATLSSVKVSEQSLGDIKVIDTLQKGETSFEQVLTIGSPRNLTFTIKGFDPAGAQRELGVYTLQVAYTDSTEEPALTESPGLASGTGAFSSLTGTLSRTLIILAAVMCVAFITLIVLGVAEKKQMNKIDRRRMLDEGGYVPNAHMDRERAGLYLFEEDIPAKPPAQRAVRPIHPYDDPPVQSAAHGYADDDAPAYRQGGTGRIDVPDEYRSARTEPAERRERPARRRKQTVEAPPREIPVEVEYDDEAEPLAAPAIQLPARVAAEDRPTERPKVIQTLKPNATAPRKNEIRHVKKD